MCSSSVNSFALSEHKIAVILLAAGRGTRMAGTTPKLLLPLGDGRPLLAHSLEKALSLHPLETIVVTRPDLLPQVQDLASSLPAPHSALRILPNPRYAEGMGTSLALGVSALSHQAAACLILLGDEPQVSLDIIRTLVQGYLRHPTFITIPIYGDQPGPPTLFSRYLFPDLSLLEGDTGGSQLLSRFPNQIQRVPFTANDRPKDIDTPEDYNALT